MSQHLVQTHVAVHTISSNRLCTASHEPMEEERLSSTRLDMFSVANPITMSTKETAPRVLATGNITAYIQKKKKKYPGATSNTAGNENNRSLQHCSIIHVFFFSKKAFFVKNRYRDDISALRHQIKREKV